MNYSRAELADRLAAEYVLGTLQGRARRRFETLLPAHPALRQAVQRWESRLAPLAQVVTPVAPRPELWARIEAAVEGPRAAPAPLPTPRGRWESLAFWRGWAAFATAAAAWLALLLTQPPPSRPPLVVVLNAPEGASSFVAGVAGDGRSMLVRPLTPVRLQSGHDLELWAVPAGGAPRSLGLIAADRATVLQRTPALEGAAALAVSLEPAGGSPTGAPTGPILFSGKLQS
ncbi:anti-sigma factor [Aquabacterium sp. A7-Y]|uniref:anti-sigma factor n=1 Tax=Aquabacterium sp. A7-Y TaxID=1349605 RepID=UPI00223DD67D|nr:anti-sigma factor [Aquabacterium sp. A7-Y]MCW7539426.1 anti-sigma factor [Aquabacterium sp. A7-Y]